MDEKELEVEGQLYKKMYLRMVKAVMDAEEILNVAMQECEDIFITQNHLRDKGLPIPVVRFIQLYEE